jgi:hypothetical protein
LIRWPESRRRNAVSQAQQYCCAEGNAQGRNCRFRPELFADLADCAQADRRFEFLRFLIIHLKKKKKTEAQGVWHGVCEIAPEPMGVLAQAE